VRPSVTASSPVYRLDATSGDWFSAVCTGQRQLQQLSSPSTGSGTTQQQAVVVETYDALAKSATATASKLTALKAPVVSGGPKLKTAEVALFKAIATGYAAGSKQIAAARPASTDALRALVEKVEADVAAAGQKATVGAPQLDARTKSAIDALPACKA
jgi:hypothetical protein